MQCLNGVENRVGILGIDKDQLELLQELGGLHNAVGHLGISQAHIEYIGQVLDAEVVALLQVEPTGQLQDLIRLLWLVGGHVRVVQQSSEQVQGEAADHRVRRADEQFLLQEQLQQAVSPQLQDIHILAAGKVRDVAKDGQQDALLLGA